MQCADGDENPPAAQRQEQPVRHLHRSIVDQVTRQLGEMRCDLRILASLRCVQLGKPAKVAIEPCGNNLFVVSG
jgi:hypothetical protein